MELHVDEPNEDRYKGAVPIVASFQGFRCINRKYCWEVGFEFCENHAEELE
jgi:hypothetical protein